MLIKKLRRIAKTGLLLALLFFSVLLFLNFLVQRPSVQDFLVKRLSDLTDSTIRTARIELNLWRGIGILVQGLEIGKNRGQAGLRARKVRIILGAGHLIRGKMVPVSIYMVRPVIELNLEKEEALLDSKKNSIAGAFPQFWIPGLKFMSVSEGQVHFKEKAFFLHGISGNARLKASEPILRIEWRCRGKIGFEGETAPFHLAGHMLHDPRRQLAPTVDMTLRSVRAPLTWIPWPGNFLVKKGSFQTSLKISGNLSHPLSVAGRMDSKTLRFLIRNHQEEKAYRLPGLSIDFKSRIGRHDVHVPFLKMHTDTTSLSLTLDLDFRQRDNPLLRMEVQSPYMDFKDFKRFFPTPLLPSWLGHRLFPLLLKGQTRLDSLLLHGRVNQFRKLERPENRSVLSMRVACKAFSVFGMGMELPFEEVSADVLFENGDFKVAGLNAHFGRSVLRGSDLFVAGIAGDSPVYDVLLDGSFDLHELMRQKNMAIIPPDVIRALKGMEPISGDLECLASFRYEDGWPFPRTRKGEFFFKNVLIEQDRLRLPVSLKEADFHVNPDEQNRFGAIGAWGNSTFHAIGILGDAEKKFPIQWANVSADMDMNEALPLLNRKALMPLRFSGRLPSQAAIMRQGDRWSCQGKADLEGVTLRTAGLIIDPPGKQDMISFDFDFRGDGWIDLNKIQWDFGRSSLIFSGSFNRDLQVLRPLKISATSLSLDDMGIRVRAGTPPAGGQLSIALNMDVFARDPLSTQVTGRIEGRHLAFFPEQLPSPVTACDFTWQFSGERIFIPRWKMKIGQSLLSIRGDLLGWDGFLGQISISSDYVDAADFLQKEKFSLFGPEDEKINGFLRHANLHLKTNFARGRWKHLEWGPLKADLELMGGDIHLESSTLHLERGRMDLTGHLLKGPEPELFLSGYLSLQQQPVGVFLEGLGIREAYVQGDLSMKALLQIKGKKPEEMIPSLTGRAEFHMGKGLLRESRVFVKILDFLSLQKVFRKRPSELSKERFYFESMTAGATIDQGLLRTDNFVMESPIWDAVGSGEVDLAQKTINFDLGIRPLETIDMMVANIPILGHVVTGADKSFLTYYFKAKGPWKGAKVEYVPFKNLGSGVAGALKRLFLTPVRLLTGLSNVANGNRSPDAVEKKESDAVSSEGFDPRL